MKKVYSWIINLMLLLFYGQGISQEVETSINGYIKSYNAPNLNKEELHSKLVEWVALNQESYQGEILLNINEKIITNGDFSLRLEYPLYEFLKGWYKKEIDIIINYTLIISIRDDAYDVKLALPKKVKVTQLYGPYIYTVIDEGTLSNNYNDSVTDQFFENKMKTACIDCSDRKLGPNYEGCEDLLYSKQKRASFIEEYCNKKGMKNWERKMCNCLKKEFVKQKEELSKIEEEEIKRAYYFEKDFAISLNEKVRELFFESLSMETISAID